MLSSVELRKHICLFVALLLLNGVSTSTEGDRNWQVADGAIRNNDGGLTELFRVGAKREKIMGYGWEQCEFSPMSCLLRRRRRSIGELTAIASWL